MVQLRAWAWETDISGITQEHLCAQCPSVKWKQYLFHRLLGTFSEITFLLCLECTSIDKLVFRGIN